MKDKPIRDICPKVHCIAKALNIVNPSPNKSKSFQLLKGYAQTSLVGARRYVSGVRSSGTTEQSSHDLRVNTTYFYKVI